MLLSLIGGKGRLLFLAVLMLLSFSLTGFAQKTSVNATEYFAVEDYYRVKWGHADEFIQLWRANHYPLLKKVLEKGDIISIKAETPVFTAAKIPAGTSG